MTALSLDDLAALERLAKVAEQSLRYDLVTQHAYDDSICGASMRPRKVGQYVLHEKVAPVIDAMPALISQLRAAMEVVDKARAVEEAYLDTDNYVDDAVCNAIEDMRKSLDTVTAPGAPAP